MENKEFTYNGTRYELIEVDWLPSTEPLDLYTTPLISFGGKRYVGRAIPNELKEVKKDYEVLKYHAKHLGNMENKIVSIKRLSDGEVFTIGDKNTHGIIENFYIGWAGMEIHYRDGSGQKLCDAEKVKKEPLFITSDGKKIFEGDDFYMLFTAPNGIGDASKIKAREELLPLQCYQKTFSTEDAATGYILFNKPILSLNDLLDAWDDNPICNRELYKNAALFLNFKNAAKKKLTQ